MTVTDNGDGTYTVSTTAEEQAIFARAVTAGAIPGGTAARALEGHLIQAFRSLEATVRRALLKEVEAKLQLQTVTTLETISGSLS